jgi:hypothetical protein
MQELQIIEAVINKSLEKGVFTSAKEIASVLQALQSLAQKIQSNGSNDTNN